jgi:hypothetical protein
MPSRHWRTCLAAGGLALALALPALALGQSYQSNRNAAAAQQSQNAQDAERPPRQRPATPAAPREPEADPERAGANQERSARELIDRLPWWLQLLFLPEVTNTLIMVFTLFLTLVAFMQHFLEKRLARETGDSIQIARDSAAAAKVAADAAVSLAQAAKHRADIANQALTQLERPFLAIEVTEHGIARDDGETKTGVLRFRFRNVGRTSALITRIAREITFTNPMDYTDPIDPYSGRGHRVPYGVIIAPGESTREWHIQTLHAAMRAADIGIEVNEARVFLGGYVRYRDFSGTEYLYGFNLMYWDQETGFDIASPSIRTQGEDDPYNYDRHWPNQPA